ncbi:MAG: IS1182 family transposase [Anaerolineae bacterium]
MLRKRSPQLGLFEADQLYLGFVGKDTFYGFLAQHRGELFHDEDFAECYSPDTGRPSVPPSLLATALVLQRHDNVSDEEAKARADYDLRWKVALGVEVGDRPFAKSTLQLFRAQLVLKEKMRAIFEDSLAYARQSGYLKKRKLQLALDTTYILGRGAVEDTYNLLAEGIRQLMRAIAEAEGQGVAEWAQGRGLERYLAPSIKGSADVEWGDKEARNRFLHGIVTDAEEVLELAAAAQSRMAEREQESEHLEGAGALLRQLITQDVETCEGGSTLKEGVARDRIVSVHDPEMRHGHKSKSNRFEGHKVAIAVDADSQLITAVEVLAGNAPDSEGALGLTEASEANTGLEVAETIGDCAYGDGVTRQAYADAGRKLVARVASRGGGDQISKDQFRIDLEEMSCTCPAGQTTRTLTRRGYRRDRDGKRHARQAFHFDGVICAACPLRAQCVKAKGAKGRTVGLHPQERLLQEARALQDSPAFEEYTQRRQVVEHRLARLVQLGIRQARYFGHPKTLYQAMMAATVANLTLVATKTGKMRPNSRRRLSFFASAETAIKSIWHRMTSRHPSTPQASVRNAPFRLCP